MKIRKNIRLKEYNYSSKGKYFVTICVKKMKYIFGELDNNKIILNNSGNKLENVIINFENESYNIDYYQIMPNHVHLIIEIKKENGLTLSQIVSKFKSEYTRLIKTSSIWQRGYYERVIRDQREYDNIVKYINENPFRDKYNW